MILVDTGYFVALADPRDELHPRALQWTSLIAREEREPLLVTEYVLLETVNLLARPLLRQRAMRLADAIRSDPAYAFEPASPEHLTKGLALFAKAVDQNWSLTDCISFEVMRSRGITRALAYDRHFEQAGFTSLLRRDP